MSCSMLVVAKVVAHAGLERERHARRCVFRIHEQLIGRHARIEVAVGRRGALQIALDLLVGRVAQARSDGERQMRGDALEERVMLPGPVHLHVDSRR